MKMTFRWYGIDDKVTLKNIKQIPNVTGVVSAIYDIPVGDVWPIDKIKDLKETVNEAGLELEVIESVPVHEDIKLRRNDYERYIENYKQTIRNLAKCGIKCICYNFMPVFDWTRSSVDHILEDGSTTLVYYKNEVDKLDPTKLSLPGWDSSYSVDEVT
ncbi:MAG: mannonate dehydratase, partial [Cetobacterium sp.]